MFRHVGIVVNDIEKQLYFYKDLLGLDILYHEIESGYFLNKILKTNPELVKQVSKCVSNVMNDKDILDKIKIIQDQTLDKSEETDDCLASTNELRQ